MITEADVAKLRVARAPGQPVLSLYLWVPVDVAALRGLPARADELIAEAATGIDDKGAARPLREDRQAVRRLLEAGARDWLGHTAAIFVAQEAGLAEVLPLPCRLPDRAVVAARPHVRPLLAALQWCPAYQVAVADRQHAWLFRISGDQVSTVAATTAPQVRSPGFGGWYGLESYRVNQRIIQLARHHYHDTGILLRQAVQDGEPPPLVLGGHEDTLPAFTAALPADVRDRVIGSIVVDPHTMTPARVRELAAPVVKDWVSSTEQRLATEIRTGPPGGLTAIGLDSCLAAVNARAVSVLLVPAGGLVPGFACERCGTLASTPDECPHQAADPDPVPDLLEEMAVATLDDGGKVVAIRDLPAGPAARLRFPLAQNPGAPAERPGAADAPGTS
jgi:peptide chain release factor subunit 1